MSQSQSRAMLDKTVSLFEGGAGKSFCSHSERICLPDLCDTSLGFVLPPPGGDVLGMSSWAEIPSQSQDMLE